LTATDELTGSGMEDCDNISAKRALVDFVFLGHGLLLSLKFLLIFFIPACPDTGCRQVESDPVLNGKKGNCVFFNFMRYSQKMKV
jgi:hypothetical protein